MKKTINLVILPIFFLSLIIASCKKKESSPEEEPSSTTTTTGGGTPITEHSFMWQENGGTTNTADSTYWTFGPAYTGIRAYKGGLANFFEINWAGGNTISLGTKTLATGMYSDFTFLKGSNTYTNSTTQYLSITTSNTVSGGSYNEISGNFNVAVSGGTTTSISGTFVALQHKY